MPARDPRAARAGQQARFNARDVHTGDPLIDAAIDRFFALTDEELRARSVHRNAEHWMRWGTEGVTPAPTRSDKPWARPHGRRTNEHTWTRQQIMEARG